MIITNVSISTMAAPLGKPANGISKETLDSLTPKDVESFSFIVDHVIGEKKIKTNVFLPGSSRPKEEIMIAKAFESCTFKAVASCLAGIVQLTIIIGWLVVLDLTALSDSVLVNIPLSSRETEKEKK